MYLLTKYNILINYKMTRMNYLIQQSQYQDKQSIAIIDISQILRDNSGNLVLSDGKIFSSYYPGALCQYFTKILLPQKLSLPLGEHRHIKHQALERPPTSSFIYGPIIIELLYKRSEELPKTARFNNLEHTVKLSDLSPEQVELFMEAIGWNLSEDLFIHPQRINFGLSP